MKFWVDLNYKLSNLLLKEAPFTQGPDLSYSESKLATNPILNFQTSVPICLFGTENMMGYKWTINYFFPRLGRGTCRL